MLHQRLMRLHVQCWRVKCFLKNDMPGTYWGVQCCLKDHWPGLLFAHKHSQVIKCRRNHTWTSHAVRNSFIDFFHKKHGHLYVPSSSVIPRKDQGTYFTNAGMNQFSDIFQGTINLDSNHDLADAVRHKKVTNSQKCIRIGGKHNDLDEVGKDVYHHTFFEMLGNWSFGDYFKEEACQMAYELLIDVYRIPVDRLYFTYFKGDEKLGLKPDTDTKHIWMKLGVPESRILPFGIEDNFWEMGDTGPCGPCTEIHYNYSGDQNAGKLVNAGSPEMVEIWNLVFMQYHRQQNGLLTRLPKQHVDTGMGLERILAVLQNTKSNYDTDLFLPIFQQIQKISGCKPYQGYIGSSDKDGIDTAYRIVADHVRMLTVCIADGLIPGKTKLEFRLRKVMHRCIHQARFLGVPQGQLETLVDIVADSLGKAYPEISENKEKIKYILTQTEDWYTSLMEKGQKIFMQFLKERKCSSVIKGEEILELVDGKYGVSVPIDAMSEIASIHDIDLDLQRYHEIVKNRNILKDTEKIDLLSSQVISQLHDHKIPYTDDKYKYEYSQQDGAYKFDMVDATIVGIVHDGNVVETVAKGDKCGLLLDKTCFYSESGGQVADIGKLSGENISFDVEDVQKIENYILHIGTVTEGSIQAGSTVSVEFEKDNRLGCMRNHTATHLLNASLRRLFTGVNQEGSCVEKDKLSFKFTCHETPSTSQLDVIQNDVLSIIKAGFPVTRHIMSHKEAVQQDHIVYLVNEKYPHEVAVININAVNSTDCDTDLLSSSELCGGTHVTNTRDLESFCILKAAGAGIGLKKMVCVTGPQAKQAYENGKVIEEMYEKLENYLMSSTEDPFLFEQMDKITQALQENLIPKQTSDIIAEKLKNFGKKLRKVNANLKKQEMLSLKKDILSALQSGICVHSLTYKNPKSVQRVLSTLKIENPIVFVSEIENKTLAVVHLPKRIRGNYAEVITNVCNCIPGAELLKHSENKMEFHVIVVHKSTCGDFLKQKLEEIITETS